MVNRMMIEFSHHLDVSPVSLPACTPDEIVAHYQLDSWTKTTNAFVIRFYASGDAALLKLDALKHDIEAGTVWEPPEEPSIPYDPGALAALHKEIDAYSGIGSIVRGAPQPHYNLLAAAQNPYQNALNKVLAQQQVITSHDWHHDGNNWACLVCGSKFDPMTPTCSGINAADWAVPVWETEPVVVWKHGMCGCGTELCPAMDGEGATQCSKCQRCNR